MSIRTRKSDGSDRCGYLKIAAAFLADNSLPFAEVLSPHRIERVFAKHNGLFGSHGVYSTAAGAAVLHDKLPRQISFTGACPYVLANWMLSSSGLVDSARAPDLIRLMLNQIAQLEVANRPGRLEPRVVKKRPKPYPHMTKPRAVLREELRKQCT